MARRDAQRRSSLSTLFEVRGRRSLVLLALALLAFGITYMVRR